MLQENAGLPVPRGLRHFRTSLEMLRALRISLSRDGYGHDVCVLPVRACFCSALVVRHLSWEAST